MVAGERRILQRTLLVYFGLTMIVAWVFVPFAWMIMTSIKPTEEVYRVPLEYLPRVPTLGNYSEILEISSFPRQFMNSTIVSVCTAVFSVVLASLAGYGLSRFRFPGARLMETFILITHNIRGRCQVKQVILLTSRFYSGTRSSSCATASHAD
jgi:ABC-type glycerol-3-phosphate transport system permease component